MAFEMSCEVGLIVKADNCGDFRRSKSLQEELTRRFDTFADQIRMGGDAISGCKAADEMSLRSPQPGCGAIEGDVFRRWFVEHEPKLAGNTLLDISDSSRSCCEAFDDSLRNQGQGRRRCERISADQELFV